jgi:hypothetical protein
MINKFLGLLVLIAAICFSSQGATVLVSQSGGSVGCGADGTQTTTALASVTWTAGNTYKICGALSSAITPTTSGTSGSIITIFFESGAGLSSPVFPVTGAINLSGLSWITVDGGVPCGPTVAEASCNGTIQNTANACRCMLQTFFVRLERALWTSSRGRAC